MTESESALIRDFMRIVKSEAGMALEVGFVVWDGPHSPMVQWQAFQTWPQDPGEKALAEARQRALRSRRFFRVCASCGEKLNVGHMFDAQLCQSCACSKSGVVF